MAFSKKVLNLMKLSAGTSATGYAINQQMGFKEPQLLVALPMSIVGSAAKDVLSMPQNFNFEKDALRRDLHEVCKGANLFDRMTVPPVNAYLAHAGVPLDKEAFQAIVNDIRHTQTINPLQDPVHETVSKFYEQATHQKNISRAFKAGGEIEGAVLHGGLACAFLLKGAIADATVRHIENAVPTNMDVFNP